MFPVARNMNDCQIWAGTPAPYTMLFDLSRNGCSSALLPTQTAAPIRRSNPTIQACAFSWLLPASSHVPVLPAVSQPRLFTLAELTWLIAYVRSLMFCGLMMRGASGLGRVSL